MAGLIRRAPLAFFSFLEELLQGPADETHDKKDDILMFMMLEEFMKNCWNAEVRTESYVERIVPAMSDSSFRQYFRLSRPTAQRLVNILGTCPELKEQLNISLVLRSFAQRKEKWLKPLVTGWKVPFLRHVVCCVPSWQTTWYNPHQTRSNGTKIWNQFQLPIRTIHVRRWIV